GINNTTLALSAGTFRENMQMGKGNYALAGHNMANHSSILFSPLYDYAKKGQKIYITNLNHVYTYKIYQRKLIDRHQVQVVNNTKKPIITLITCDETGNKRLMVHGKLIQNQKLKHAPKHVQNLFKQCYTINVLRHRMIIIINWLVDLFKSFFYFLKNLDFNNSNVLFWQGVCIALIISAIFFHQISKEVI